MVELFSPKYFVDDFFLKYKISKYSLRISLLFETLLVT